MSIKKGIYPAVPTPFNEDESIDYDSFKKLLQYLVNGGVHGLLIGGSTGEYTLMSVEERKTLIKIACEETSGKVSIMAGVTSHKIDEVIELTEYAAKVGSDTALVVPPYYLKNGDKGILEYYKTLAKKSSIGIVIYHYPAATNLFLEPKLIYELSKIDGVVGIKNTTDQNHTCQVISLTKDVAGFSVFTGYQHLILPTLAADGEGAICIIPSLVPEEIVKVYDLAMNNNFKEAIKFNQKLMPLYNFMDAEYFPGPVKAGLSILGLIKEKLRPPLVYASDKLKAEIEKELIKLGYFDEKMN